MAIPPVPGKKLKGAKAAPKRQPQHSASVKKKAAAKKAAARKVAVDPSPAPAKSAAKQAPKKRSPATKKAVAPAKAVAAPERNATPEPNTIPVVAGKAKKADHAHKGLHRLLVGTNIFLALCVLVAGGGYAYIKFRLGQLDKITFGCQVLRNCGDDDPGKPMNVLLVGSDTRANISKEERAKFGIEADVGGERTDTMMVLHVDPKAEKASILSIPRDLYLPIAGTGRTDRINTAYGYKSSKKSTPTTVRQTATTNESGLTTNSTIAASAINDGPERLIATIRQNLGIEIDHYIEVDFNGFRGIVNAVDGVTVPFPAPARDKLSGLDVKTPGCVSLSGDQALGYVRSRHFQYFESGKWRSDLTGDIGRIQRQQDFIRRMIRKAISKGVRNPIKLNALIGAGINDVKLDSALSTKDIFRIGKQFRSLEAEAVDMLTLPTDGFRTSAGASVLKLRKAEAQEIIDRFNGLAPVEEPTGEVPSIPPSSIRVRVLNGTGVNGQAGKALRDLSVVGFGSGGSGDAKAYGASKNEIRYATGQLDKAKVLQAYIVGGATLVLDKTLTGGDLQLTLGSAYGGVRSSIAPGTGSSTSVPATTTTVKSPIPQPKGATALDC